MRQFISDHFEILKLIDFNGNRIIKGIGVDPAILSLKKTTAIAKNHQILIKRFKIPGDHDKKTEELVNELFLKESPSYESFFVDQAPLKEGSWRLYKPITRSIIEKIEKKAPFFLSQLGESFQGMITGNDKAFIFKQVPFELKDPAALKPWLKNKDVLVNRIAKPSQWLVYTDGIKDMEAETGLLTYLSMHRKKLEKRRECRLGKRPWYFLQWGRALKRFESKKIVFPYKASINRFAVDVGGSCFSADIYGMLLNEQCCYTEETLVLLLNSRLYNYYFKSYAKKLGNNLYEYYPNTVLRLKIPVFNAKQLSVIKDYYDILKVNSNNELRKKDENQFNDFLYHYFELNKDERDEIEKVRVGCRKIFST